VLPGKTFGFSREDDGDRAPITRGDIAILRFLQALEQVEEDLWRQYTELGGTRMTNSADRPVEMRPIHRRCNSLTGHATIHPRQYDDEISHASFLRIIWNRKARGPLTSPTSKLLPSSTADGAQQIGTAHQPNPAHIDTSFCRATAASPMRILIPWQNLLRRFPV